MTVVIGRPARSAGATDTQFRPLVPSDEPQVLALLTRCSRNTLFHRFHGFTDGAFYARQLATGADHMAIGALEGPRCIAMGSLAPAGASYEVGVLVEDAWHRRGVGTALLERLVALANSHGITELGADVLGEDAFALPVLAQLGPIDTSLAWGVYRVRLTLADRLPRWCPDPKRGQ